MFYKAFEDAFRGPREEVKSRLRVYLPFVEPVMAQFPTGRSLDLGCGRGEWLELLLEREFDAIGIDLDEGILQDCRERGLSVELSEALSYLRALPESSICVVTGFHIIEHLRPELLMSFLHEAYRVLVPGGLLILETPNPENISVGTTTFYIDPTHIRPIPCQLLKFLVDYCGFSKSKVLRLQERPTLNGNSPIRLIDVLTGVSPDYGVVAQKGGEPLIMQCLEPSFDRNYGLTLEELSERYQEGINVRIRALEADLRRVTELAESTNKKLMGYSRSLSDHISSLIQRVLSTTVSLPSYALRTLTKRIFRIKPKNSRRRVIKKIAVDLTPVLPGGTNGGAKIFALELVRRLAEIQPATEFVLLTQDSSHDELSTLEASNVRCLKVIHGPNDSKSSSNLMALALSFLSHLPGGIRRRIFGVGVKIYTLSKKRSSGSLLRDLQVDLLFCPFTAPTFAESNIPTVCTIYDLQHKTYPEFFTAEEIAHRDNIFISACNRSTKLAVISNYSRSTVISHSTIEHNRIRTIYLRMARRICEDVGDGGEVLNRLGIFRGRYLLYPANYWKHKNHEMLFTAFSIASKMGLSSEIKLICTGALESRRAQLQSIVSKIGLAGRITVTGYLPNDELKVLMDNSVGVVFPSLYEGFGLPIIEAMASGVAVCCSNRTSLPEIASNAALLFDPRVPSDIARTILALVNDEKLRENLIIEGRKRANDFSNTEEMAQEYWTLFEDALMQG